MSAKLVNVHDILQININVCYLLCPGGDKTGLITGHRNVADLVSFQLAMIH